MQRLRASEDPYILRRVMDNSLVHHNDHSRIVLTPNFDRMAVICLQHAYCCPHVLSLSLFHSVMPSGYFFPIS